MPGYSQRTLVQKLGIRPAASVLILGMPRGYRSTLGDLPDRARVTTRGAGPFDVIQLFAKSAGDLAPKFRAAKHVLKVNGMLWISWPKRSSGVKTDLDENIVRALGLALRLVDVKVCAVDDTWSGLKFVIPLAERNVLRRVNG